VIFRVARLLVAPVRRAVWRGGGMGVQYGEVGDSRVYGMMG